MILPRHIFYHPHFCFYIIVHGTVSVQVVGGEVEDHRHVRLEMVDLFHLERTYF